MQPAEVDLGSHRSLTSNYSHDRGAHTFGSISQWCGWGWDAIGCQPEIIEIECNLNSPANDSAYVLLGNKGRIIARKSFVGWDALLEWVRDCPNAL